MANTASFHDFLIFTISIQVVSGLFCLFKIIDAGMAKGSSITWCT